MILVSTLLSLASFASPLLLQEADDRKLVVYDVQDLALVNRLEVDVEAFFQEADAQRRGTADDEQQSRWAAECLALSKVVQRHVQPPFDPGEGVQVMKLHLAANVTPDQHAWIAAFLDRQRSDSAVIHTVEVRMMKLPAKTAVEIGMTELPLILDGEKASELLKTCMELPDVDVLNAPTVSVFNRRRAEISTITQVAYVSRWERHENVLPTGETILDPVVEVISEGITITCRVTRVDNTLLDIDLQMEQSEITDLPTVQTELGEITVPVVARRSMRSFLALQSGYTAVFSGLGTEGETMLILVCVTAIAPEPHRDR